MVLFVYMMSNKQIKYHKLLYIRKEYLKNDTIPRKAKSPL